MKLSKMGIIRSHPTPYQQSSLVAAPQEEAVSHSLTSTTARLRMGHRQLGMLLTILPVYLARRLLDHPALLLSTLPRGHLFPQILLLHRSHSSLGLSCYLVHRNPEGVRGHHESRHPITLGQGMGKGMGIVCSPVWGWGQ